MRPSNKILVLALTIIKIKILEYSLPFEHSCDYVQAIADLVHRCHLQKFVLWRSSLLSFSDKDLIKRKAADTEIVFKTEVQIYRTKAMEREEKRKQKSKQRLISRVEAILSGVDMESKDVNDNNTEENSFIGKFPSQLLNDNEDHKLCPAEKSKLTITEDENADHDNQNVEGFHDTAYRSSLRNLLQKSLTMSKSGAKETSEIKEGSTSSESETDGTENTVVETHDKTTTQGQQEASRNTESKSECGTDSREFFDEEENAVSNLVESVIEEAKTKILNETDEGYDDGEQELEQKHFDIKNQDDPQNESLWKTPMVIRDAEHVDEISPQRSYNGDRFADHPETIFVLHT